MTPDQTDNLAIDATDLRAARGGRSVLHIPRWQVALRDHWLVRGPSGSGKTTLLHLVAGLLRPASGSLQVLGANPAQLPTAARDRWRGENIGLVFQHLHLINALSVLENLKLADWLGRSQRDDAAHRALLEQLSIDHLADKRPHHISTGEAQRVAIARALVNRPSVLLVDEPTSALDDDNCARAIELLIAQAREYSATLIVVTHDQRIAHHFEHQLSL